MSAPKRGRGRGVIPGLLGLNIPNIGGFFLPPPSDALFVDQYMLEVAVDLDLLDTPPDTDPSDGGGTLPGGSNPDLGLSVCGSRQPVVWVELLPKGWSTPLAFSKQPLNFDPLPAKANVQSYGTIVRALSSTGTRDFRGTTVTSTFIDIFPLRQLRELERSDGIVGARYSMYLSTVTALRTGGVSPRRVFDGIVTDAKGTSGLLFSITAQDRVSALMNVTTPPTYPKLKFGLEDFPNMGNDASSDSPGNPKMLDKEVPLCYGFLSDEDQGGANAVGVCPVVYTGQRTIPTYGSFLWDEYVVCRGAISNIPSFFVPEGGGLSTGTSYASRSRVVTSANPHATYLIPGSSQWTAVFGSARTRIFNGREYTVCYATGSASNLNRTGTVPLVLNVDGYESVGDRTGTVIDSFHRQCVHFLVNFVTLDYQSGVWAAIPTVAGDTYTQFDIDSFEAARTTSARFVNGGFKGAWYIGGEAGNTTLDAFIARMCRNGVARIFVNKDGQVSLTMYDDQLPLNRRIIDAQHITERTFNSARRRDNIYNSYTTNYGKRWAKPIATFVYQDGQPAPAEGSVPTAPDWAGTYTTTPNAGSVSRYDTRPAPTLELDMIADRATAIAVTELTQAITAVAPFGVSFTEVGLCGTDTELGQRDDVTHFEGMDADGWTDQAILCEKHTLNPDELNVAKEYVDLSEIDFSNIADIVEAAVPGGGGTDV